MATDLMSGSPPLMQVIDLFSGCGGLSCGAALSGLNVVLGVEMDPSASKSFSANFPDATTINARVESLDPAGLDLQTNDTIICGGPPCQGFSSSNQRNRDFKDPKNHLYLEMIRYSDVIRPKALVFENVYGITEGRKQGVLDKMIRKLKRRFISVDWAVLNSVNYGVPQIRRRVFVVARQSRSTFVWPKFETHTLTVSDAIGDLPKLGNGACIDILPYESEPNTPYASELRGGMTQSTGHTVSRNDPYVVQRYNYIPQGGNWKDVPDDLMTNYANKLRCHTGIYRRLSLEHPSVVIGNFRKNMLIHPVEHRGLSVREAARIQSFPDRFVFEGSIGKRQQQVGNAVPPKLASAVLTAVSNC